MTDSAADPATESLERLYDDPEERLTSLDQLVDDDEHVTEQEAVLKAMAHEHRIRVLEALREGELCACELQAILDAPQSTVASHLGRLKEAGLVRTRRQGKWTYYRIGDTAVHQLLDMASALIEAER